MNYRWDIRCCECGRFISNEDLISNRAHTDHIPDSEYSTEATDFTCPKCVEAPHD